MDDVYSNEFIPETGSSEYSELLSKIESLDVAFRNANGKKRNGGNSSNKKLLKRLKVLENDVEQLKYYIQTILVNQRNQPWWRGSFTKSLPNLINLVSVVAKKWNQPKIQLLSKKDQALYLLGANDSK